MVCNTVIKFVDLHEWNATFIAKERERKLAVMLLFNRFIGNKPLLLVKYTDLYCWNESIVRKYKKQRFEKMLKEFDFHWKWYMMYAYVLDIGDRILTKRYNNL